MHPGRATWIGQAQAWPATLQHTSELSHATSTSLGRRDPSAAVAVSAQGLQHHCLRHHSV